MDSETDNYKEPMEWDYVRHVPDGEIFALQMDANGDIFAVAGPLHYREVTFDRLRAGNFEPQPDDLEWAKGEARRFHWRLIEQTGDPEESDE